MSSGKRKNGADACAKKAALLFLACKRNPDLTGQLAVILFAPKPNSQSYVVTQNDLVEVELGCVSCPEQNHIFVQPILIDTPPLINTYPPNSSHTSTPFIILQQWKPAVILFWFLSAGVGEGRGGGERQR